MNESRVRRLAAEGRIEITRKAFKRCMRDGRRIADMQAVLSKSELKDEDVFSYPDYTFSMGLPSADREFDLVCVQTPDGMTVRIVGLIPGKKRAERKTRGERA